MPVLDPYLWEASEVWRGDYNSEEPRCLGSTPSSERGPEREPRHPSYHPPSGQHKGTGVGGMELLGERVFRPPLLGLEPGRA